MCKIIKVGDKSPVPLDKTCVVFQIIKWVTTSLKLLLQQPIILPSNSFTVFCKHWYNSVQFGIWYVIWLVSFDLSSMS